MYKLGLSTQSGENLTEEYFKSLAEAGIKATEISVNDNLCRTLDYEKIKEWADKWEIELWSFHLPFWPFDKIDISAPSLASDTVKYLSTYIEKASKIGIRNFIIHASGEPIENSDRPVRMQTAKNSLKALATFAEEKGARILVENLPRTCLGKNSSEIIELISVHPALEACFDTNHLLGENYVNFIHVLGKNIKSTHISDYDFKDERHWLPGEGEIDWQRLITALDEVGYYGPWLYEIDYKAPWTITRERDLVPKDFKANADNLFSGNKPVKLGIPKENL